MEGENSNFKRVYDRLRAFNIQRQLSDTVPYQYGNNYVDYFESVLYHRYKNEFENYYQALINLGRN